MVVAVTVLATDVWVVTMLVATVGVGSVDKVGLADKVGLVGVGCAITLTLYLLFTGTLALLFFSAFLGIGVLLGEEFLSGENMLVCSWLLSLPSSSKCFHLSYQGWIGTLLHSRGCRI